MAGSYVLPQVQVFQEFAAIPNDVTQNLNACVIGPAYEMLRASDSSERKRCTHDTYPVSSVDGRAPGFLPWSDSVAFNSPDIGWFGVTFEQAHVKLNTGSGSTGTCINDRGATGKGTMFEFKVEDKSLDEKYSVRPGDFIGSADADGKWTFSKIRSLTIGTPREGEATSSVKRGGVDDSNLSITLQDTYTGGKSGRVTITVADGKMTWASTLGIQGDSPVDIPAAGAAGYDIGLGIKVGAAEGVTAVPNGKYVVTITIHEPYVADTVTTVDLIDSATRAFSFFRLVDSVDVDQEQLTASGDGVTVDAGATVNVDGRVCEVVSATAYLTQRNLRSDHTDGVYSVRYDTDIIREFGAITPDNPLAYALSVMLQNSVGAVRYIGIASDDAEGYAEALKRASVTTAVYGICPLTSDLGIIDSVTAHCATMSSAENKSWRIAFVNVVTPQDTDITPVGDDGKYRKCTIATADGKTTLTCEGARFVDSVQAGDTVVIYVDGADKTAKVDYVGSNTTLVLTVAVTGAAGTQYPFKLTHVLQPAEYVQELAKASRRLGNRRVYNVYPNRLRDTSGNYVSGVYGAAAVCALACSVAPQQPITNVEIKGFYDLPDVYSTFGRDELNDIAAGGTLILMQDGPGDTVYVRHQISTDYSSGNLNNTELSLVKNLDSISYYFADRFRPYIGRYNVTDDLLAELRAVLHDGLSHLETATEGNRLVGPQVIAEGTEIRTIYQDPDNKDHVYANVALNLPAPFNNFDLHLSVI